MNWRRSPGKSADDDGARARPADSGSRRRPSGSGGRCPGLHPRVRASRRRGRCRILRVPGAGRAGRPCWRRRRRGGRRFVARLTARRGPIRGRLSPSPCHRSRARTALRPRCPSQRGARGRLPRERRDLRRPRRALPATWDRPRYRRPCKRRCHVASRFVAAVSGPVESGALFSHVPNAGGVGELPGRFRD